VACNTSDQLVGLAFNRSASAATATPGTLIARVPHKREVTIHAGSPAQIAMMGTYVLTCSTLSLNTISACCTQQWAADGRARTPNTHDGKIR
jgi:hypothetical protein